MSLSIDQIKNALFTKTVKYLDSLGLDISYEDLDKNISICENDIETLSAPSQKEKSNKKIKFKPKNKSNTSTSTKIKVKKSKFSVKSKSQYSIFVDICTKNNFTYFQFNDEYDWVGPATKIDECDYKKQKSLFSKIECKIIKGTGFYVIHPNNKETDTHISYDCAPSLCASTQTITSDDEDLITETEEYEFRNNKYLLDKETNDIYCINTYQVIGKRVYSEDYRDYIIEFN